MAGRKLTYKLFLLIFTGFPCADSEAIPAERQVCGETIAPEEDSPLPLITPAMNNLAQKYPELEPAFTRDNYCVSGKEECKAKESQTGGVEIHQALSTGSLATYEQKVAFHNTVTDSPIETIRDDMSTATQKGFIRQITATKMLYRIHDHEKFHENAEGLDIIGAAVAQKEQKEQERLAEILKEMEVELAKNPKDEESLASIAYYRERAEKNAHKMALISCEYSKMAATNRKIEDSLTSLTGESNPRGSTVTGEVKVGEVGEGSISEGSQQESVRAPASPEQDELLSSFEMRSMPVLHDPPAANWEGSEEDDLFGRVHRKYRQKDELGFFQKGLLD